MISRSDLDVYIDSHKTGVNEFYNGFTGMGAPCDLRPLLTSFFLSFFSQITPESFLLPIEKKNKKQKRKTVIMEAVCAEV